MKLISSFKYLWRVISKTLLCVRYPFLYPRNRWTGKHYNCWKILEYHRDNYDKAWFGVSLQFIDKTSEGYNSLEYYKFLDDQTEEYLRTGNNGDELTIYYGKRKGKIEKVLKKIKLGSKIKYSRWLRGSKHALIVEVESLNELKEEYKGTFKYIHSTLNPWLAFKIKFLDWLERTVLQIIHFPTSYTELDQMSIGWKKAFGKEFCKDLKKAIIKTGGHELLFNFRITQIKEKYGELRVYYEGYGEEIDKVIEKYRQLSQKTCIMCGKPATYISKGWISPYCDDCIPDKENAEKC